MYWQQYDLTQFPFFNHFSTLSKSITAKNKAGDVFTIKGCNTCTVLTLMLKSIFYLFFFLYCSMSWDDTNINIIIGEVVLAHPFQYKYKTTDRAKAWQQAAEARQKRGYRVDSRAARNRINILKDQIKAKNNMDRLLQGLQWRTQRRRKGSERQWRGLRKRTSNWHQRRKETRRRRSYKEGLRNIWRNQEEVRHVSTQQPTTVGNATVVPEEQVSKGRHVLHTIQVYHWGLHRKEYAEEVVPTDGQDKTEIELTRDQPTRWYLPHHSVYHPHKPDKLCVVFDCAAC